MAGELQTTVAGAMLEGPNPAEPSASHRAMCPYWDMVETELGGAATMRAAGKKYLPKFPNESDEDYEYRRANAKYTNIFRDIVENLASKPFAKEVDLVEKTSSAQVEEFCEDIDGQGNNLNVFASTVFFQGIADAIDWILVDKPPVPENASRAVEAELGAKPYWVHIPAKMMLAVYSAIVKGKEEIVHARISEPDVVMDGYKERAVERVRELNRVQLADGSYGPATWALWEKKIDPSTRKIRWDIICSGVIAIGVIALVPFVVGRRKGRSWELVPPMQDAAFLQVEHYQQETNLKSIKELAAFPMLSANGVAPPEDKDGKRINVPVGPKTVLFAPPGPEGRAGSWTFIEPGAQTLTFLASDLKATEQNLRELGRQPLTAQSGNLTVVTAAVASQKSSSAVQAWALALKDCLELALQYSCLWLNDSSEPEVRVHTDFAVDTESDKAPDFLLKMREKKEISRIALVDEAKRRDLLSADYDAEKDMELILAEEPSDPTPQDVQDAIPPTPGDNIDPATGKPKLSVVT